MFAVLHVPDFALQAVIRTRNARRDQPAALLEDVSRRACLVACNESARQSGVAPGQTAPQALAFCPNLRLFSRELAAEVEARAALLAAAFTLSPKVELTADDVCTVDLSGLDEQRGRALLEAALQRLEELGLSAAGGFAASPLLALYAARSVWADNAQSGASTAGKTVGRLCRVIHDARAFLGPLPLAMADPEPELASVLAGWGVHTLGALTALPKEAIARRLGATGLALWERAAGETTRVLRLVDPPREFAAEMEFEHEVETLEPLLFILRRFIDRLALELETSQLAAAELALTLELTDDSRHARSFRLPEPTTRADTLFRTLHTHLEQVRTAAPIRVMRLHIKPMRPPHRQQGLFETELRDPHGFAETLARVVAIVGSDRVGTPRLQNTHRPDAVTLESPAAVVPPPVSSGNSELPLLGLPLRRFRPPLPARVQLREEDHSPMTLWSAYVSGEILDHRGPWRGAGDWWEAGRAWEREEWDVELSSGGLYRLVRSGGEWFVEGEYD